MRTAAALREAHHNKRVAQFSQEFFAARRIRKRRSTIAHRLRFSLSARALGESLGSQSSSRH